jgi:hypothetical protein
VAGVEATARPTTDVAPAIGCVFGAAGPRARVQHEQFSSPEANAASEAIEQVSRDRFQLGLKLRLRRDGELVAAVSEERLNRCKLWYGFPEAAIDELLRESHMASKP